MQLGWDAGRPVVLFVGRMINKKGLPAIEELARQFPECDWALAGWGPVDPRTWELPNVKVLGPVDQPTLVRYYQAADLLILPSLTEGFPLVVQESLACGTPAVLGEDIASGAPGVERVIYQWCRSEGTLADRVREALADRSSWPEKRQAASEYARLEWDWDECARRYLSLFEDIRKTTDMSSSRMLASMNGPFSSSAPLPLSR
jgi:glycosyltransferase involved in cell wall biosynthesis